MDNILIIDGMNNIHRANTIFGKRSHNRCEGGFTCGHKTLELHCECGGIWDSIDEKCLKDVTEEYVLIYNFFRNLRATVEQFSPDKIFFVLEGHPEHRYAIYPQYKANRIIKQANKQESRDKFNEAVAIIVKLLKNLPITTVRAAKFECDDVIGTLVENLKDESVTIFSNDSDFTQLLQKGYSNLKLYNPIKKEYVVAPEYPYLYWKALNGDASDNISKLLTPAKALKAINNPEILSKFMELEENRANFNINKELIEIKMVPDEDLIVEDGIANWEDLKTSFNSMRFNSITNDKSWNKYKETFDCVKF